jgi:hypothetical protein
MPVMAGAYSYQDSLEIKLGRQGRNKDSPSTLWQVYEGGRQLKAASARRRAALLIVVRLVVFWRLVMPDYTAGRSADRAMMMSEVAGSAAHDCTFNAALGFGSHRRGAKRKSQDRTADDHSHLPHFLHVDVWPIRRDALSFQELQPSIMRRSTRLHSSFIAVKWFHVDGVPIEIAGAVLICPLSGNKARALDFATGRSAMISKSTIAAMMFGAVGLVSMGLASPAFAQVPPAYYDAYPGAFAYPYEPPPPLGWAPYGYSSWPDAATIDYNIHTPPNHWAGDNRGASDGQQAAADYRRADRPLYGHAVAQRSAWHARAANSAGTIRPLLRKPLEALNYAPGRGSVPSGKGGGL